MRKYAATHSQCPTVPLLFPCFDVKGSQVLSIDLSVPIVVLAKFQVAIRIAVQAESTVKLLHKSELLLRQTMILTSQRPHYPLTVYKLVKIFEVRNVVLPQNQNVSHREVQKVSVNVSILPEAYEALRRLYNFKVRWIPKQKTSKNKQHTS